MTPKFEIGQKVIISPVRSERLSPRDCELEPHAGQSGEVTDYYWLSLGGGTKIIYIYTVRIGTGHKEAIVHEDELEAYIA